MRVFYSKVVRPEKIFEEPGNESKTERAGYIPVNIQVQQMIRAGVRLNQHRAEQFDYGADDKIDWGVDDPTRDPGFDMAEASELLAIGQENLAASAANQPVEAVETENATETQESPEA